MTQGLKSDMRTNETQLIRELNQTFMFENSLTRGTQLGNAN